MFLNDLQAGHDIIHDNENLRKTAKLGGPSQPSKQFKRVSRKTVVNTINNIISSAMICAQGSHYSWNFWKTPGFLKFSSRALENCLKILFHHQLLENSLNLSINFICRIKKYFLDHFFCKKHKEN